MPSKAGFCTGTSIQRHTKPTAKGSAFFMGIRHYANGLEPVGMEDPKSPTLLLINLELRNSKGQCEVPILLRGQGVESRGTVHSHSAGHPWSLNPKLLRRKTQSRTKTSVMKSGQRASVALWRKAERINRQFFAIASIHPKQRIIDGQICRYIQLHRPHRPHRPRPHLLRSLKSSKFLPHRLPLQLQMPLRAQGHP